MFHNAIKLGVSVLLFQVLFIVGCPAQQTEEQALQSLREMTRDGKLPPEDVVANIESRFAGKKTGAQAKHSVKSAASETHEGLTSTGKAAKDTLKKVKPPTA